MDQSMAWQAQFLSGLPSNYLEDRNNACYKVIAVNMIDFIFELTK